MTLSALGTIEELQLQDKGYYKMILCAPAPFETKVLRFNIWKADILKRKENGRKYEVGDQVRVAYHHNDAGYLCLDEISLTSIDSCPVCYNALEAIDTQRMDCDACSILPTNRRRERVNQPMILVSCTPKEYMYSTGYRIELKPKDASKLFTCVIFPKTLLYPKVPSLVVGNEYNVLAWRQGNLLTVLDIFA